MTLNAGAGNDSVHNFGGQSVKISASDGNNYIYNDYTTKYNSATQTYETILPDNATISAGAGNDTIYNYGSQVSIDSGAGNDSIRNSGGQSVKIISSDGDNYIYNDYTTKYNSATQKYDSILPEKVTIVTGVGNDSILGFNETSTLEIASGSYSSTKSGSDIVVTFGTGKITLVGAGSLEKLNIAGSEKVTTPSTLLTVTNSTTSPLTIDAAVKNVNASKRTTAIKITGNALANSIVGGSKNDSIYGNAGKLASSC